MNKHQRLGSGDAVIRKSSLVKTALGFAFSRRFLVPPEDLYQLLAISPSYGTSFNSVRKQSGVLIDLLGGGCIMSELDSMLLVQVISWSCQII